jgi:hypothetical protein
MAGPALADDRWTDISDAQWVADYGVTADQASTVAEGYPDGTFKPYQAVNRGQFAKMGVSGLDLEPATPLVSTFSDVSTNHVFYSFIEGAYAEGIVGGFADGTYRPGMQITRQQANSMMGRYLSEVEIAFKGHIEGLNGLTYATLEAWYAAQGHNYLPGFTDWTQVAEVHRPTTAYLVRYGVVRGSGFKLTPLGSLTRAQAVAMVLRTLDAKELVAPVTPPPAPTGLSTNPGSPSSEPRPFVTGQTIPNGQVAIYDSFGGAPVLIAEGTAGPTGEFSIRVPAVGALAEGMHSFTARVKNQHDVVSAPSTPVSYRYDATPPQAAITQPADDAAVKTRKPAFAVTATDAGSGVDRVRFEYALSPALGEAPEYAQISVDYVSPYVANWGVIELPDGEYLFRAEVFDVAGNGITAGPVTVVVDLQAPQVELLAPEPGTPGGIFFTENRHPLFAAEADDPPAGGATVSSGVARVDFLYALLAELPPNPAVWTPAEFTLLSSDDSPGYAADWTGTELPDGHYVFAVQSTDRAGNTSALSHQEVVIDNAAPVVEVLAPLEDERVMGGAPYTIEWIATDVYFKENPIKVEFSDDNGANWEDLAGAMANTGVLEWNVPGSEGDADVEECRIRVTATDARGRSTPATSGEFVIDNTPPDAPTNVVGVDGHDFSANWTPSASDDVAKQLVFILPAGVDLELEDAHMPVAVIANNTTLTWTGDADIITTDSAGDALAAGDYKIWIVAVDEAGWMTDAASNVFTVTAD